MKNLRTKKPKTQKDPSNFSGRGVHPNITVSWGRGASEYRPGLFTKQYFVEHGEVCATDIYYALSQEIERLNKERIEIDEKPFKRPNYSSFARYFHWFKLLGLIESTDKREAAIYDFLQQRQFYQLTTKGKAEVRAWEDPLAVSHPEFR